MPLMWQVRLLGTEMGNAVTTHLSTSPQSERWGWRVGVHRHSIVTAVRRVAVQQRKAVVISRMGL